MASPMTNTRYALLVSFNTADEALTAKTEAKLKELGGEHKEYSVALAVAAELSKEKYVHAVHISHVKMSYMTSLIDGNRKQVKGL